MVSIDVGVVMSNGYNAGVLHLFYLQKRLNWMKKTAEERQHEIYYRLVAQIAAEIFVLLEKAYDQNNGQFDDDGPPFL